MMREACGPLFDCFLGLDDPRDEDLIHHKLLDIVIMTICAVICGANGWTDVFTFGKAKEPWLRGFLELPEGIPSHDTIGDLFARLDSEQFRRCFIDWVNLAFDLTGGQVVAVDGKTVRHSYDTHLGKNAIHMVNAWATENCLVLGQTRVEDKTNEITAIPELLDMLELSGCIVTIDAMGCQKEIAQKILDRGADYALAVKDNQPILREKLEQMFSDAEELDYAHTRHDIHSMTGKDHGRVETRTCWVIDEPRNLFYIQGPDERRWWPGLRSLIKIEATRRIGEQHSTETRYYISSRNDHASAFNAIIRSHWGVENSLHWVLDIAFREDDSRIRSGHAAENLAVLRQLALNLLKQERTSKRGIRGKRLKAALDTNYLIKVLAA